MDGSIVVLMVLSECVWLSGILIAVDWFDDLDTDGWLGQDIFKEQSRIVIGSMIWKSLIVSNGWLRKALQSMINYWNKFFDEAEEMDIDFCLYVSPYFLMMLIVWFGDWKMVVFVDF